MKNEPKLGALAHPGAQRDAIHVAVVPMVAERQLSPGERLEFGVVDPFLVGVVPKGATYWMVLFPGTITSLRHEWTHPAFLPPSDATDHKTWMLNWAREHMSEDYYGDGDKLSDDVAYDGAIRAGHDLYIGPYESARDYINDEWWTHWEAITGRPGKRGEYFSCGC